MTLHRRKVAKAGALVLVGGVGVAALLWGKLRLLTDVPRTTYAEPEQARDHADGPVADRSESDTEKPFVKNRDDETRHDENISEQGRAHPDR